MHWAWHHASLHHSTCISFPILDEQQMRALGATSEAVELEYNRPLNVNLGCATVRAFLPLPLSTTTVQDNRLSVRRPYSPHSRPHAATA